jgi:hypothetical protein
MDCCCSRHHAQESQRFWPTFMPPLSSQKPLSMLCVLWVLCQDGPPSAQQRQLGW